ncbi:uncharacterized protein V6R79_008901 [Siganus canaliculatus]
MMEKLQPLKRPISAGSAAPLTAAAERPNAASGTDTSRCTHRVSGGFHEAGGSRRDPLPAALRAAGPTLDPGRTHVNIRMCGVRRRRDSGGWALIGCCLCIVCRARIREWCRSDPCWTPADAPVQ